MHEKVVLNLKGSRHTVYIIIIIIEQTKDGGFLFYEKTKVLFWNEKFLYLLIYFIFLYLVLGLNLAPYLLGKYLSNELHPQASRSSFRE